MTSFRKFLPKKPKLTEKQIQESLRSLEEKGLIIIVKGEPFLTLEGKKIYNQLEKQKNESK